MTRLILLFALTTLSTTIHADGIRWSVRQMTDAVYSSKPDTNALNEATLCGRIVYQRQERKNDAAVAVEDSTGNMLVICTNWLPDHSGVKPGCEVEFSGLFTKDFNQKRFLIATRCRIIRTGPAPIPLDVRIADLLDGKHDFQLSRISGTLRDATFSETCPGWIILVLCEKSERIYLFVPDSHNLMALLRQHLGEQVSASGICTPYDASARLKGGRIFKIASGKGLSFSGTAETPGTECPPISEIRCTREAEILSLGHHYVVGHVLAVWQNRNILLKTPAGDVVGLALATENQPRFGDTIKAVGLPESDLFRINLTHCTWTRMPAADADEVPARSVSPRSITSVHDGYELIDNDFHGQSLQMSGLVRGLPNDGSNQMHIECDGRMVVVDASANAAALTRISVGCTVNVSGTCVILHEKRPARADLGQHGPRDPAHHPRTDAERRPPRRGRANLDRRQRRRRPTAFLRPRQRLRIRPGRGTRLLRRTLRTARHPGARR